MPRFCALAVLLTLVATPRDFALSVVPSLQVTLSDLTVPKDRLPDGCQLKVIEPAREVTSPSSPAGRRTVGFIGPTRSMLPPGTTVNPWTGSDRRVLANLRQFVENSGPLRLPDGPPLTSGEESAIFLRLADGIEEGYAAAYADAGGREVGVYAIRFTKPPARLEDSFLAPPARQKLDVIDFGLIRAALFGDRGPCSSAIASHLKSLVG